MVRLWYCATLRDSASYCTSKITQCTRMHARIARNKQKTLTSPHWPLVHLLTCVHTVDNRSNKARGFHIKMFSFLLIQSIIQQRQEEVSKKSQGLLPLCFNFLFLMELYCSSCRKNKYQGIGCPRVIDDMLEACSFQANFTVFA